MNDTESRICVDAMNVDNKNCVIVIRQQAVHFVMVMVELFFVCDERSFGKTSKSDL